MMHFHQWSKWEDVKLGDQLEDHAPLFVYRQVITQQRRCAVCNLVRTRTS